jgi:hypothetical protein
VPSQPVLYLCSWISLHSLMEQMAVCWDLPAAGGEQGRVYGQKNAKGSVKTEKPLLPPGVGAGGHGGSHGSLTCEFVDAILRNGELMKIPQYTM